MGRRKKNPGDPTIPQVPVSENYAFIFNFVVNYKTKYKRLLKHKSIQQLIREEWTNTYGTRFGDKDPFAYVHRHLGRLYQDALLKDSGAETVEKTMRGSPELYKLYDDFFSLYFPHGSSQLAQLVKTEAGTIRRGRKSRLNTGQPKKNGTSKERTASLSSPTPRREPVPGPGGEPPDLAQDTTSLAKSLREKGSTVQIPKLKVPRQPINFDDLHRAFQKDPPACITLDSDDERQDSDKEWFSSEEETADGNLSPLRKEGSWKNTREVYPSQQEIQLDYLAVDSESTLLPPRPDEGEWSCILQHDLLESAEAIPPQHKEKGHPEVVMIDGSSDEQGQLTLVLDGQGISSPVIPSTWHPGGTATPVLRTYLGSSKRRRQLVPDPESESSDLGANTTSRTKLLPEKRSIMDVSKALGPFQEIQLGSLNEDPGSTYLSGRQDKESTSVFEDDVAGSAKAIPSADERIQHPEVVTNHSLSSPPVGPPGKGRSLSTTSVSGRSSEQASSQVSSARQKQRSALLNVASDKPDDQQWRRKDVGQPSVQWSSEASSSCALRTTPYSSSSYCSPMQDPRKRGVPDEAAVTPTSRKVSDSNRHWAPPSLLGMLQPGPSTSNSFHHQWAMQGVPSGSWSAASQQSYGFPMQGALTSQEGYYNHFAMPWSRMQVPPSRKPCIFCSDSGVVFRGHVESHTLAHALIADMRKITSIEGIRKVQEKLLQELCSAEALTRQQSAKRPVYDHVLCPSCCFPFQDGDEAFKKVLLPLMDGISSLSEEAFFQFRTRAHEHVLSIRSSC